MSKRAIMEEGLSSEKKRDSAVSKSAILAAAAAVLSAEGYAGATISKVAQEANVSRGLLHYHFQTKEAMFAEVLSTYMQNAITAIQAELKNTNTPEQFVYALIASQREIIFKPNGYMNLFLEGLVGARQSPIIKARMDAMYRSFREMILQKLTELQAEGALTSGLSVAGMAISITAILDGIGIQLLTIPDLLRTKGYLNEIEDSIVLLLTG